MMLWVWTATSFQKVIRINNTLSNTLLYLGTSKKGAKNDEIIIS